VADTYNENVAEGGDEQRHGGKDQLPGIRLGLQPTHVQNDYHHHHNIQLRKAIEGSRAHSPA
jgi:hypothetical protein